MDWRVRHLPGVIMIADLSTKPLPVQRTLELKELMSTIQRKVEEEKKKEAGPEAVRGIKKREDEMTCEGEFQREDDLCVPKVTAKQLQLVVMMALIAQSKTPGQGSPAPTS